MMRMSLRGLHLQRGASHTPLSQAPLFSSPMGTENSERLSKKPLMHTSLHLARSDSVVIQSLSRVRLFAIPWTTARQASQSFTFLLSLLKLTSTESVMPSSHLILCHPFTCCPQSFQASGQGCFQKNRLFISGGQSIRASASASVLPMNIQG